MSDQRLKIAVFIDFDNIEIGVKTTLGRQFDIGAVLETVKERGEIITKIAYGDWKRAGDHGRAMSQHAVRLVQRVMTPGGDKNGADINLALDALEMAFTHDHINAFVIVGGDSDFITLVEKLKQYDKKVFVVGGRAFTSQVMQKNCTEFIAYENVTYSGVASAAPSGLTAPTSRGRSDRSRAAASPIDQALPLVKRALKVLADREVSPQLGLLKSTLLQLDSSFSERDYGAGTFRDFAEKLEKQGFVTLKHHGRTTLVELADEVPPAPAGAPTASDTGNADSDEQAESTNGNLGEGVALVRAILAEATTPPRWPMYVRQFKQFVRSARPDFDERRFGSIVDLMRACQKDGFLRLERDRQGGLRVFASGPVKATAAPHGWGIGAEADADELGMKNEEGRTKNEELRTENESLPAEARTDADEQRWEPGTEEPGSEEQETAAGDMPTEEALASDQDDDNRGNRASVEQIKPKRTRKSAGAARKAAKDNSKSSGKPKGRTPSRRSRGSASTVHDVGRGDRAGRGGGSR
jgi:uncharacterized LabA/DUF88 family protein